MTLTYVVKFSLDLIAISVNAMMAIKAWYKIKRNWMGDPCTPKAFTWDGLNCTFSGSIPPRITTL